MKSLRCYRMRSCAGIGMAAIVNSLTPISATTTQTPLDKITNNYYIDEIKQIVTLNPIYLMLLSVNNKITPSVPNYNDIENRRIVITYFLNDIVEDITSFLNIMDELINTNWVINTQKIGFPFKEYHDLTGTESYKLLNNIVDFYDNNKNILKTDLDMLK